MARHLPGNLSLKQAIRNQDHVIGYQVHTGVGDDPGSNAPITWCWLPNRGERAPISSIPDVTVENTSSLLLLLLWGLRGGLDP